MRRWTAPALLAAAVAARLAIGCLHPPQAAPGALPDTDGYAALAASLVSSGALSDKQGRPSAHREPGYPFLLALAFASLGKHYAAILALNAVLGALTLILLYRMGSALYGETVGRIALAAGAFYPPFLYYAAQPLRETAMAFWAVTTLALLTSACRAGGWGWFAAAGAAAAAGALTKTTFLAFGLGAVPIALALLFRRFPAAALARVAAYSAAFLLLYAAWPIRNHWAFGTWIIGATEGGGNNFYVYQKVPQEFGGTPRQAEIMSRDPIYASIDSLDPVARDKAFWRAGWAQVRSDPWRYARLVAWRLCWDQWRLWPRARNYEYSYRAIWWTSLLTDGWIIPLGFAGMLWTRFRALEGMWLCLFVFSEAVAYSLVLSMIRYRFAVMPVLILYAAFFLDRLWKTLGTSYKC